MTILCTDLEAVPAAASAHAVINVAGGHTRRSAPVIPSAPRAISAKTEIEARKPFIFQFPARSGRRRSPDMICSHLAPTWPPTLGWARIPLIAKLLSQDHAVECKPITSSRPAPVGSSIAQTIPSLEGCRQVAGSPKSCFPGLGFGPAPEWPRDNPEQPLGGAPPRVATGGVSPYDG